MPDEIFLDPFIRTYVGRGGIFLCRENPVLLRAILSYRNFEEKDKNEQLPKGAKK